MQKPLLLETAHRPAVVQSRFFIQRTARHGARNVITTTARAFTLLEILVVLAIASIIIGIAVANLDKIMGRSQERVAKMFVTSSVKTALFQYRMDVGDYPSTAEGLRALIAAPGDKAARWRGPYIENGQDALLDPWQQPYQYRYPGTHNKDTYDLWSKGADKQDGTADDIGNWTDDTANTGTPGGQ